MLTKSAVFLVFFVLRIILIANKMAIRTRIAGNSYDDPVANGCSGVAGSRWYLKEKTVGALVPT